MKKIKDGLELACVCELHVCEAAQKKEGESLKATTRLGGGGPDRARACEAAQKKEGESLKASTRLGGGGPDRDRTDDLVIANDALSQLSYRPISKRWTGHLWSRHGGLSSFSCLRRSQGLSFSMNLCQEDFLCLF